MPFKEHPCLHVLETTCIRRIHADLVFHLIHEIDAKARADDYSEDDETSGFKKLFHNVFPSFLKLSFTASIYILPYFYFYIKFLFIYVFLIFDNLILQFRPNQLRQNLFHFFLSFYFFSCSFN